MTKTLPMRGVHAARAGAAATAARLVSVGTATPPNRYTQDQVLEWAQETDPKIRALFRNSHISTRHLYLPPHVDGRVPDETNEQLLERHLNGVLELGPLAVARALGPLELGPQDVDFLVCVTSTGFLCPGVSAHLIREMGLREDLQRVDIVGMGCNAAVNALQSATAVAASRPGSVGVVLCVEICSAAYVLNRTLSTAVVNSLFGDGAVAVVVRADHDDGWAAGPAVTDFESFIHTETIGSMKYGLEGGKLSFFLARDIPWVIGANAHRPVDRLLRRNGLERGDVDHWVIHSGGKKVIDAIAANLGLSDHDVRHTRAILRTHGNLSSGAVLFGFQELRRDAAAAEGDVGVLIAMGPGMSIETALLRW
ncbi:MAG TPA: 3,5-dihydroxyphenylacetyl-CoA synthase DpgA [Longimicrobiaceae bacterium]|nr:3,5-dihydroxyphenylacetyl-CoA synthase DpgA [Longimicrobiaceae bacterium]